MTEKHNRVARVVRDAALEFVNGNLKSDIHENTNIGQDGLEGGLRALRPDMVFKREGRGGRVLDRKSVV
jgi:hypothetical protein